MPSGLSHGFSLLLYSSIMLSWVGLKHVQQGQDNPLANVDTLLVPHMSLLSDLPASGDMEVQKAEMYSSLEITF